MMINAVLSYLQKKASAQQATLTFTMDTDFFNHITAHLDDEQIAHLLADLGQNALIATLPCESRCIHIALSMTKSIPSICISDSGTPFPTVVLEHLGLEKCSQHLDEGGVWHRTNGSLEIKIFIEGYIVNQGGFIARHIIYKIHLSHLR